MNNGNSNNLEIGFLILINISIYQFEYPVFKRKRFKLSILLNIDFHSRFFLSFFFFFFFFFVFWFFFSIFWYFFFSFFLFFFFSFLFIVLSCQFFIVFLFIPCAYQSGKLLRAVIFKITVHSNKIYTAGMMIAAL